MPFGTKNCLNCGFEIIHKIRRDIERKKFCGTSCRQTFYCKNDIRYKINLQKAIIASQTSETNKKKGRPGNLNGRYLQDRTKIKSPRKAYESSKWRKQVFERDNYTCVLCNQRGGKLNADHIKPWCVYPEFRFDINNGRTLCIKCHKETDTYGSKSWKFKKEIKNVPLF